jgi:signal transduction histidine kinase/CheY-like chemotaxis protein
VFLLERIDMLALMGLFTQTGVTWIFLIVFLVLWRTGRTPRFVRTWSLAFLALAVGLSAVSVRYFLSFDDQSDPGSVWLEGSLLPRLSYSVYLFGKILFALLLLRGAAELAGDSTSRRFWTIALIAALVVSLAPAAHGEIHGLLLLQVPVIIVCAALAWLRLTRSQLSDLVGVRIIRFALAGMALLWVFHGAVVAGYFLGSSPVWGLLRAINSHLDLALELPLGAGLIVTQLEDARRRLREAQAEQAGLRQEIERDERLRALGRLVSGVAHELNNPLTAILGFSEESTRGEPSARALRVIHEQAERCRGIVRSLSALAGGHSHEPRPNDLSAMVRRVGRGFQPQLQARELGLRIETDPSVWVQADAFGIEQLLVNLLSNAIDASPRGGTIVVRSRVVDERVLVEVLDQGPGVPPAARAHLFEPFFSTKPSGAGTGLGLAVAFGIVQAHGGRLAVDTARGGGARFFFDLSITYDHLVATPPPLTPEGDQRMLLLVEDDQAVRSIVAERARRLGWRVVAVDSAERALEVLRGKALARRVDRSVILCDLRMPGMGGWGLHRTLQEQGSPWLERCLFFTGDLASAEAVDFAARIARPLIGKPFDFGELFRTLDEVADAEPAPVVPPATPPRAPSR